MFIVCLLQAHAASAVLNFSENCTPDILTPYLDVIVTKLLVLLQVILLVLNLTLILCALFHILLLDDRIKSRFFSLLEVKKEKKRKEKKGGIGTNCLKRRGKKGNVGKTNENVKMAKKLS